MDDIMNTLLCYFEKPLFSEKYFFETLNQILPIGRIKKIKKIPINSIKLMKKIESHSHNSRLILTNEPLSTAYDKSLSIEGIGIQPNNIALVSYQENSVSKTVLLIAHEIGHVFGASHCNNKSCVMGITYENGRAKYAWKNFSRPKTNTDLFCPGCYYFISRRFITNDIGGL